MAVSLYRKYRPQKFSEVVGQNHVRVTLQNEVKQGKIAHAYLFSGPRGIGKTTTARILAKAVNCEKIKKGENEPCNKCSACQEITEGRSLDVMEIDAASHTGVDNVRDNIIDNARFTPSKLKYKVFIIDEVHMLSLSAFNALLKILEEPPEYVIFVLCTTEIHKIPVTIVSRCQRFDFGKVSFNDITDHLNYICKKEGVNCDKEVLENIARHSEGYLRDAVGLLGQILTLGEKKINLEQAQLVIPRSNFLLVSEFVDYLVNKDTEKSLKLINRLVDEGININQFTIDLIEFLRKLLLAKISGRLDEFSLELDLDSEKKISAVLEKLNLEQIVLMIDIFITKNQAIKQSTILQLPLEMAVVEICGEAGGGEKRDGSEFTSSGDKKAKSEQSEIRNHSPRLGEAGKSEIKNSKSKKSTKGLVKLSEVEKKWSELISTLNENNHSLALTLRVGQPLEVDGHIVKIGFKYKFHQERLADVKNKLILAETLSKVMDKKLEVEPVVADDIEIDFSTRRVGNDGDVGEVAEMFGGKVVG